LSKVRADCSIQIPRDYPRSSFKPCQTTLAYPEL